MRYSILLEHFQDEFITIGNYLCTTGLIVTNEFSSRHQNMDADCIHQDTVNNTIVLQPPTREISNDILNVESLLHKTHNNIIK